MSVFGHVIGDQADPDYDGSVLTAALNVGDLTLTVEDAADFDELAAGHGGRLLVGVELDADGHPDPATGTALAYTTCDDETDTITLASASTVAAVTGDRVYIENPVTGLPVGQLEVLVALDDGDTTGSALPAILDAALLAGVGDGISLTNQAIELDEDEDGQLVGVALPGLAQNPGAVRAMQDQLTVSAPGDQILPLSFRPMLNSEHLYWNGVYQPGDQWSRDQWTVTIPDGAGYFEVGDVLAMEYLYADPTPGPRRVTVDLPAHNVYVDSTATLPAVQVGGTDCLASPTLDTYIELVASSGGATTGTTSGDPGMGGPAMSFGLYSLPADATDVACQFVTLAYRAGGGSLAGVAGPAGEPDYYYSGEDAFYTSPIPTWPGLILNYTSDSTPKPVVGDLPVGTPDERFVPLVHPERVFGTPGPSAFGIQTTLHAFDDYAPDDAVAVRVYYLAIRITYTTGG